MRAGNDRHAPVAGVEGHRIRYAAAARLFLAGIAICLAVVGKDLRVRLAGDQIVWPAGQVLQRSHRVDHPLDTLSRAQQPPRQEGGSARTLRTQRPVGTVAPCGIVVTLRRSTSNPSTQPLPCGLGHDDHLIRHRRDRLENRTLVWRRVFEDCVGDDDRRHPQPVDDVHHVVSVDTAIDSVLMLDDGDVALVQQLAARRYRCRRTVDQLSDHPLARGRRPVGHAHDTHIGAIRAQGVGQGSGERRQPAMRRRIGTEDADTKRLGEKRCASTGSRIDVEEKEWMERRVERSR